MDADKPEQRFREVDAVKADDAADLAVDQASHWKVNRPASNFRTLNR